MQGQEKELFQSYEIKNWNFSPRLYKIFAAAAVFNLLVVFVAGQANVFTTRGCDSPLVGNFCQVLDTIYVGSTLLGTDSEFDSRDYVKTEIGDAEITYIDVTGVSPPLTYPEGYFAIANPNEFAAMQNPTDGFPMTNPISGIPGFPMTNPTVTPGMDLMNTPQALPTPNNNAFTGNIPTSPFSTSDDNPIAAPKTSLKNRKYPRSVNPTLPKYKSPTTLPKIPGDDTLAENKVDEKPANENPLIAGSDAVTDFKPNKKPLEDFADGILAKRADKNIQLDLTKAFKIKMVGELDKDGKLDPNKSRYVKFKPEEQGDQTMVDLAKEAVEAINNSNLFYYLKSQGVDKVEFTLIQDDKQMYAVISSSQKTEERAKTISSGLSGLLSIAKLTVKEPELLTLIESSKVEPQGKNFVLNFKIDKPIVQEIINRKLQEAQTKKEADAKKKAEENKPSSTAQTNNANLKTAK